MDEFSIRRAQKYLAAGLAAVSDGELETARENFKLSSKVNATADALTYWGWMEHHLGNTEVAISLCEQAIKADPEFGNPYNDIGSYLVSKGQLTESIPWFEKAIEAKRYEPRQFPHINLGKVYLQKNMPARALKEFRKALEFSPEDNDLLSLIERLQTSFH